QEGKCVIEARPAGCDKGKALEALMDRAPFAGRRPVAIGDDLTDGAMTEAARRCGGLGLSVGVDLPGAKRRFETPCEVRAWLACKLAPPRSGSDAGPHPALLSLLAG
ncbi:MAG: trehalose-phosphatase, partial [Oceanicaulis sp.]